jgi:hypothetical protein
MKIKSKVKLADTMILAFAVGFAIHTPDGGSPKSSSYQSDLVIIARITTCGLCLAIVLLLVSPHHVLGLFM